MSGRDVVIRGQRFEPPRQSCARREAAVVLSRTGWSLRAIALALGVSAEQARLYLLATKPCMKPAAKRRRKPTSFRCEGCDGRFPYTHAGRRYCSHRCKMRVWRASRKAAIG